MPSTRPFCAFVETPPCLNFRAASIVVQRSSNSSTATPVACLISWAKENAAVAIGPAVPDMSRGRPIKKSPRPSSRASSTRAAKSCFLLRPSSGGRTWAIRPSSSAMATPTRALPRSSAQARGGVGSSVMPKQREDRPDRASRGRSPLDPSMPSDHKPRRTWNFARSRG